MQTSLPDLLLDLRTLAAKRLEATITAEVQMRQDPAARGFDIYGIPNIVQERTRLQERINLYNAALKNQDDLSTEQVEAIKEDFNFYFTRS